MDNLTDHPRIGGQSLQISDCFVWAEINYLDSPTDYREYIPKNCARPANIHGDGAVMLESHVFSRSSKARQRLPWLVFLFGLIISWFLPRLLDIW